MGTNGQTAPQRTDPLKELFSHIGTGNADPIIMEIEAALEQLLAGGAPTTIDLGAIPFAAGDERILDAVLGQGELRAVITVLGESLVEETGIPGVWRIDHFDEKGETQSRFVEVTFLPEILKTQREDAELGLTLLRERLAERRAAKAGDKT